MAYIGLRKPFVGKRKTDGKYETPEALGKAVSTEVTPNYAEGSLYGDDRKVENDKEFVDATIALGVTTIPTKFGNVLFGHTVSEENETTYNADDEANEVGFGFIGVEKIDGVKKYVATFLPRAKFNEPGKSYQTKGENITYNTPNISGAAMALESGDWKYDKEFATEAEAEAYIMGKFGKTS